MPETSPFLWVIEFKIGSELVKIRLDDRLIVGRFDKKQTRQPDIDLSKFGAEELGVSRHHLAINVENDHLTIIDLQSGNGTLLNNARLEPNKPYPVKHNDQIRLGNLTAILRIIVSSGSQSSASLVQRQQGIELESEAVHESAKGQLVLIVEDHPEVAKVLSIVMERAGFTTQVVHDVARAMRVFNQKYPSAVILDLMLPDMNGLEFCRYVRRNIKHNTIPIVIVSAGISPENIAQAMQAGADIFLGKPVNTRELRQVMLSLIHQRDTKNATLLTRQLVGTAPLQAVSPDSRTNSAVLFIAGYSDDSLTVTLKQPMSFGRGADLSDKTYVDLSRFNAIEYGVSRIHMTLHHRDGRFFVEDLDSVNGTYLNGDPLRPNELVVLNNADEIRLGQLRMYIYFLTDKERGAN